MIFIYIIHVNLHTSIIGGDGDRHREHHGVSQTKQAKKKKSKRPIDPKDMHDLFLLCQSASAMILIYLLFRLVGRILGNIILITVDQSMLHLLHMHYLYDATRSYLYRLLIEHDPYRKVLHLPQSDAMAATPSATPHDMRSDLAPGQKDRLGRVMIEPDESSWHPAKDAARALKECTMCTWELRYNLVIGITFERKASTRLSSWLKKVRDGGERPDWMLPHVFDELGQYWNTNKFKAISDQAK
ncbi:hypothetical protein H5410_001191 [Solanum commersonii]|uniref:Uncharacterized protein n=1 Tax=Solanum commersonii TaxID=4109 RepID=A0A9J6AYV8_SOLCO|nr:hypothetical protein H5410_001191 [Solanum commersonii]